MAKVVRKKATRGGKVDAQQLAARRRRDELRRVIARETEIARLSQLLVRARTRSDEALEQLRDWLNRWAAEEFRARAAQGDSHGQSEGLRQEVS